MESKGINRYIGLMFKKKFEGSLEFNFKEPTTQTIHSFFVFFPFIVEWYDEQDKLIESQVIIDWRSNIKPSKPFIKIIERSIAYYN